MDTRRQLFRIIRRTLLLVCLLCGLFAGGYYGYVRWVRGNFHAVVPEAVYRSAQPTVQQLMAWTDTYNLKTVINLRGDNEVPECVAEAQAAREAGLDLINIRLGARRLPPRPWLLRLIDALETAPRPILLHCAHGADRTGLASVLAAMAVGGQPYDQARKQLSMRYLHVYGNAETVGGVLLQYEDYCRREGIATGGWQQFRDWAVNRYRLGYYFIDIHTSQGLTAEPGETITLAVRLTNRSDHLLPAGSGSSQFNLCAFLGDSEDQVPDLELGSRAPLPKLDLAPEQSAEMTITFRAPRQPGQYDVRLDLVEEGVTWFAREGSPVPTVRLLVEPDATAITRAGSTYESRTDDPGQRQRLEK